MTAETDDESAGDAGHAATLGWTGDVRWATLERPAGAVVLVLALGPFWALGGAVGALAWLAIAGSWLLFPPIVPVVFGQFLLVAVTPADAALMSLLPAEGALLALLAASFVDSGAWLPESTGLVGTRRNLADALGYLGAAIATVALVAYAVQLSGPLVAGGLCLGLVAVVAVVLRPALPDEATK